jgi:hypothetical protein
MIRPFRISAFQVPNMTDAQIDRVPGDAFSNTRDGLQFLHRSDHCSLHVHGQIPADLT